MVDFSPREVYKEIKETESEDTPEENILSLEELREREVIEQKILEKERRESLEKQVIEEETRNVPSQTNYEPFAQPGVYDLKETPNFFNKQRELEEKEKEERKRRSIM